MFVRRRLPVVVLNQLCLYCVALLWWVTIEQPQFFVLRHGRHRAGRPTSLNVAVEAFRTIGLVSPQLTLFERCEWRDRQSAPALT